MNELNQNITLQSVYLQLMKHFIEKINNCIERRLQGGLRKKAHINFGYFPFFLNDIIFGCQRKVCTRTHLINEKKISGKAYHYNFNFAKEKEQIKITKRCKLKLQNYKR